jgi:hypothetical protein
MVMVPATFTTEAAPSSCNDIGMTIDYGDPPTTIFDDPSLKFGAPVETILNFTITLKNPALAGKEIKFNSPNQFLQLIAPPLGANSVSDGGIIKYNVPSTRQNVNFEIRWPTGGDGVLTFQAKIHEDNVDDPTNPDPSVVLAKGALMTIGAKVLGGRCGAKIELYGLPEPPGLEPGECEGIVLDMYYEYTDGNFYPVIPIVQGPGNTQYKGPQVGKRVWYVITPLGGPTVFIHALQQTDTFNRQTILLANSTDAGAVPAIQNTPGSTPNKVLFNVVLPGWFGGIKGIGTSAETAGLDTVTFVSRFTNNKGPVNGLCSTHREVRISTDPVPPIDPPLAPPPPAF